MFFLRFFIGISTIGLGQIKPLTAEQVRVSIKDTDSTLLVNTIDLVGIWKNTSSVQPILGSNVPQSVVEITNGHLVYINDAWIDDYPNKLKNCSWAIVDQNMLFRSPDLGQLTIDVEKMKNDNFFEITINTFTYRKLINLSSR